MRLVRDLGVAVHAHVAHARGGDELEQAVYHAEAGAQDRDDGDLLAGDAGVQVVTSSGVSTSTSSSGKSRMAS